MHSCIFGGYAGHCERDCVLHCCDVQFFANAKWTFNSQATSGRYAAFVFFMGIMAALTGYVADSIGAPPVVTLIAFSAFSLVAGFIYSKFIVFRDAK